MASGRKIKRKPKAARGGGQLTLGLAAEEAAQGTTEGQSTERVVFNDPDPHRLFVGEQRLDAFLRQMGFKQIFAVRELLRALDLSAIEAKDRGGERQPYHPAAMLGLILHGIMEGRSSLRELETLGRSDVRAWWLTRQILKRTTSSGASVAVDGTVIQAAASRYKTIKREAAEQAAAEGNRSPHPRPTDHDE